MPQIGTVRRIVKFLYDDISSVVEFRIFEIQPNGKKARVLGGGAFEERDLDRIVDKLTELANDFAFDAAMNEGFCEIEEGEVEDA